MENEVAAVVERGADGRVDVEEDAGGAFHDVTEAPHDRR